MCLLVHNYARLCLTKQKRRRRGAKNKNACCVPRCKRTWEKSGTGAGKDRRLQHHDHAGLRCSPLAEPTHGKARGTLYRVVGLCRLAKLKPEKVARVATDCARERRRHHHHAAAGAPCDCTGASSCCCWIPAPGLPWSPRSHGQGQRPVATVPRTHGTAHDSTHSSDPRRWIAPSTASAEGSNCPGPAHCVRSCALVDVVDDVDGVLPRASIAPSSSHVLSSPSPSSSVPETLTSS